MEAKNNFLLVYLNIRNKSVRCWMMPSGEILLEMKLECFIELRCEVCVELLEEDVEIKVSLL